MHIPKENSASRKMSEFWESLGLPKFVLGPMVDRSDLPFRVLCRRYGTELSYTPMLHSRLFVEDVAYRRRNFQTTAEDSPVIAQFCGDDPSVVAKAASIIAEECKCGCADCSENAVTDNSLPVGPPTRDAVTLNSEVSCSKCIDFKSQSSGSRNRKPCYGIQGVDINLGCPQGIAKRGRYGAFLLSKPDLIESIARETIAHCPLPVTAKLRMVDDSVDYQSTLNLARRLQAVGVSAICIHGRVKEAKGQNVGPSNWDICSCIKKAVCIPVIANGGISTRQEALSCLEATGCDAVMSAEAILEYPALFNVLSALHDFCSDGPVIDNDRLMAEYLELVKQYPVHPGIVKGHLFHALYAGLQVHTDLRSRLGTSHTIEELIEVAKELRHRRQGIDPVDKLGWYYRYRKTAPVESVIPSADMGASQSLNLSDTKTSCEGARCEGGAICHNECTKKGNNESFMSQKRRRLEPAETENPLV